MHLHVRRLRLQQHRRFFDTAMNTKMLLVWWLGLILSLLAIFDITSTAPLAPDGPNPNPQPGLLAPVSGCHGTARNRELKSCLYGNTTATINAPTITTETSISPSVLSKRIGDVVRPDWFYKSKMLLKCLPYNYVLKIKPYNSLLGIMAWDFPDWKEYKGLEGAKHLHIKQDGCKNGCKCDENGRIVKRPNIDKYCAEEFAARCAVIYACVCHAILGQPTATDAGLTADDYQRAIDGIPGSVQAANRNWRWNMAGLDSEPGKSMTWSNSRVAVADPGLKEPYYIEGPSMSKDPDWNWLLKLSAATGGGLASRLGGGLSKREVEASDTVESKVVHVKAPDSDITITT
ncbi:hypothetical protein TWF696_001525 [Orbilia brochopaga]|uniref:Uncharacterized protein n=1 Tax=Orbilia brochopaga TaxID=3140254 RepID=A0AAV9UCH5_9PEZI